LLEIKSTPVNEWAFICASVGDCKAFLIEQNPLKVRDITRDNRTELMCDTDCGGRLGAVIDGNADLRNLRTYCVQCQPNDIIMVVSDGVHDNFHPELLSVTPNELKLDFTTWKEASSVINIEDIVANYREQSLCKFFSEMDDLSPKNIVNSIMQHCFDVTLASRQWMENNPGKILSKDYKEYPGKMDHTTCSVFRVGLSSSFEKKDELELYEPCYVPIIVSLMTAPSTLRICCRTIARGKFECVAKKTLCILKIIPHTPFSIPDGEMIICHDEINQEISRELKFPPGICIDVHSKEISWSEEGVISITFNRVNVNTL